MKIKNSGFTLIELMLSVALISLLAGVGVPVYQAFQANTDLSTAVEMSVEGLRRVQFLASSMSHDQSWGIKIASEVTVFQGSSFALRNTGFDETFDIPENITVSGVDEVVFEKYTSLPSATGSITFSLSTGNSKTITINEKGIVEY